VPSRRVVGLTLETDRAYSCGQLHLSANHRASLCATAWRDAHGSRGEPSTQEHQGDNLVAAIGYLLIYSLKHGKALDNGTGERSGDYLVYKC